MELSNRYRRVAIAEIKIERKSRQRSQVDPTNLLDSIRKRGVYNPILLTRDMVLVAGERRLEACKALGLADIPARFIDELSPIEARIVELEENLKRSDLHWRDETAAVCSIHKLYCELEPGWSKARTAEELGMSPGQLHKYIRVGEELSNPLLATADGLTNAFNILSRRDDRAIGNAMSDIVLAGHAMMAQATQAQIQASGHSPSPMAGPSITPLAFGYPHLSQALFDESILQADFLSWAPAYVGPPFNFIHCDFPFGVNLFDGSWGGKHTWGTESYTDTPDTYWTLLRCLCQNLDRLMSHSAHLMFWFSIDQLHPTLDYFAKHAPSLEFAPKPLVWLKSCNTGIMSDPKRQPRHIYETALIARREDRPFAKPVSDAYAAPTDKSVHPSCKPEPVLRYFFQLTVDEHTTMLDPTCGSGTALRAAESLGATRVLGLELDPGYTKAARDTLHHFRVLRRATGAVA